VLRALVRDHFGEREWQAATASATVGLHDGVDAFVLVSAPTGLGPALAWAVRAGVTGELHVLAEAGADAGLIARRAALFSPAPIVHRVEGRDLVAALPAGYEPPAPADLDAVAVLAPLVAAGAEVTVEHGVAAAEIEGLEVGRAVRGADGSWVLEVGVGKHDREASAIMEAVRSREDVIGSVVGVVRAHRRPGASPHLLNRLARQRWLRATLRRRPDLVGARRLDPVEPPLPRANLIDPAPAFAVGDGLVVACSVGVDLDLVPTALDARARHVAIATEGRTTIGDGSGGDDVELVIVTPGRDQYPVTGLLAGRARARCRLVAVEGDWPA
jgi:hypothetical protein